MSHQVREISPLNSSSNLNSRGASTAATVAAQQRQHQATANGVAARSGGGTASHGGGYVPFEPKKRELTQKIAPKMPVVPMSQDLTNLPLPHQHVQSDKQHH